MSIVTNLSTYIISIPVANFKKMSKTTRSPRNKALNLAVLYLQTLKQKISFFYILDIETLTSK